MLTNVTNGLLAFGVACGAAVAQLAWWSEPGLYMRLLVAMPFLAIAIGVYCGSARSLVLALISISILLLMIFLSPMPDWDQLHSERPDVTTEFLEARLLITSIYAMTMLWRLSIRWRQGRSVKEKNSSTGH